MIKAAPDLPLPMVGVGLLCIDVAEQRGGTGRSERITLLGAGKLAWLASASEIQPLVWCGSEAAITQVQPRATRKPMTGRLIVFAPAVGAPAHLVAESVRRPSGHRPNFWCTRVYQPHEVLDALELVELCAFLRFCS